jgi:cell division protein FtsW
VSTTNSHTYFKSIEGDKIIWAIVVLLALFSFIPVYTASSNLAYLNGGSGNTMSYLLKHFMHIFIGFILMYGIHKIPYRYFRGISILMLPLVVVLLGITLSQGTTIGGANASRWINVPVVNVSFQTSSLASVVLLVYVARYLSKIKDKQVSFKESILPLWIPVALVVGLILPANFSTAAIIFTLVLMLTFLGGYPLKYLGIVVGAGALTLTMFILLAISLPNLMPNRVDTWSSRVQSFASNENAEEQYQVQKAKIAIASGGVTGNGIGKSVQRNFLPQSSSDFIYAIIIEEMGLIGGISVLFGYLLILWRIAILVTKTTSVFGQLLLIAVGLPFIFQAFINMAVAVSLFPVTGQTLPLISSGGSSIWMTCLSLGILQSVAANKDKIDVAENPEEEFENPLEVLSETI